jgi:hypothetical protein
MATRVRGGPRRSESFNQDRTEGGPKGVRTGPSRSEPFDLNRMEGNQTGRAAANGTERRARASGARARSCIPRSGPFDLNRTEGNQTEG